jgi:hypothetical protein
MSLVYWNIYGAGTFDLNFPMQGLANVNRHTVVLASITEISQPQGLPLDFPFQGAATMRINNIVPLDNNSVNVRVEIDWGSTLQARIYFAIFD